jgi:hypothetical protein
MGGTSAIITARCSDKNHQVKSMSTAERSKIAFDMRQKGDTYKVIGEHLGVGKQRASELVRKWERMERIKARRDAGINLETGAAEEYLFSGLSVRAANKLKGESYKSKEQVRNEINSRKLIPGSIDGLGQKSFDEVCKWAEVNAPEKEKYEPKPLTVPTDKEISFYTAKLKMAGFKVTKI